MHFLRRRRKTILQFLFIFIAASSLFFSQASGKERAEGDVGNIGNDTWMELVVSHSSFSGPHLEVKKVASPTVIWPEDSATQPVETTVKLEVDAAGGPAMNFRPQDTIFIIDDSGTMQNNDPLYLRCVAAQHYVENMIEPDRGAVMAFSTTATFVNGDHLSSNMSQIIDNLSPIYHKPTGQTNFEAALNKSCTELINYGDSSHMWIGIFLTDGDPEPPSMNVTQDTINTAKQYGIIIYTIGLGMDYNPNLLKWVANETGGKYYYAPNASCLLGIYKEISLGFYNYTAGINITVQDELPDYIHYVPNSFSKKPDHISQGKTTLLQWNITQLNLKGHETPTISSAWDVTFNVKSNKTGYVSIGVQQNCHVKYLLWNHTPAQSMFPDVIIYVVPPLFPPPTPPIPPPLPIEPLPPPPTPMLSPAVLSTVTIQPVLTLTQIGLTSSVSVETLLAPFIGLGLAKVVKMKKRVKQKRTVGVRVTRHPSEEKGERLRERIRKKMEKRRKKKHPDKEEEQLEMY